MGTASGGRCQSSRIETRRLHAWVTGIKRISVAPELRLWRPIGDHDRTERKECDAMREIEIHDYARQLLEAHGAKAIAEAARNAIDLEAKGDVEMAKTWRHIEDAMKLMRGPHQS